MEMQSVYSVCTAGPCCTSLTVLFPWSPEHPRTCLPNYTSEKLPGVKRLSQGHIAKACITSGWKILNLRLTFQTQSSLPDHLCTREYTGAASPEMASSAKPFLTPTGRTLSSEFHFVLRMLSHPSLLSSWCVSDLQRTL